MQRSATEIAFIEFCKRQHEDNWWKLKDEYEKEPENKKYLVLRDQYIGEKLIRSILYGITDKIVIDICHGCSKEIIQNEIQRGWFHILNRSTVLMSCADCNNDDMNTLSIPNDIHCIKCGSTQLLKYHTAMPTREHEELLKRLELK